MIYLISPDLPGTDVTFPSFLPSRAALSMQQSNSPAAVGAVLHRVLHEEEARPALLYTLAGDKRRWLCRNERSQLLPRWILKQGGQHRVQVLQLRSVCGVKPLGRVVLHVQLQTVLLGGRGHVADKDGEHVLLPARDMNAWFKTDCKWGKATSILCSHCAEV